MLEFKAALRYIKKGGTKTMSAIVSVSLAVFLMMTVAVVGASFIKSLRSSVMNDCGNYHLKKSDISENMYERIRSDERVLKACPVSVEIDSDDRAHFYVPNYVGDFFSDENLIQIKKDLYFSDYTEEITVLPEGCEKGQVYMVYIQLKDISIAYKWAAEFGLHVMTPNIDLLRMYDVEGLVGSDYTYIRNICAIIVAIIAIASTFFISNAYMISYNEEEKESGLWTMLGASSTQLTLVIIYKAVIIALIATICGGCLGYAMAALFIRVGGDSLKSLAYMTGDFVVCFEPRIVLYIVILTLAVSIIAALRPAMHIGRKPVVEGLSNLGVPKEYAFKKHGHSNKLGKDNIFSLLLRRYSRLYVKKNISAIITISIAIVLFLSITFLCKHAIADYEKEWNAREYDVKISIDFDTYDKYLNWYKDNIERNKLVSSAYWFVDLGTARVSDENKELPINIFWNKQAYFSLFAIDDDLFAKIAGNSDQVDCIVAGQYKDYEIEGENVTTVDRSLFEKDGIMSIDAKECNKQLKAKTITWDEARNQFKFVYMGEIMIIPYKNINLFDLEAGVSNFWSICLYAKAHTRLVDELKLTTGHRYLSIYDYAENAQGDINVVVTVRFFGYLIVGMIAVIAFSNTILTTYYGITIRKKDFIVLQTLGMKNKQMRKLLLFEAVQNLGSVILISIIGFVALYYLWLRSNYIFSFGLMWQPILLTIFAAFVGYCLAYYFAYAKINTLNTVSEIQ